MQPVCLGGHLLKEAQCLKVAGRCQGCVLLRLCLKHGRCFWCPESDGSESIWFPPASEPSPACTDGVQVTVRDGTAGRALVHTVCPEGTAHHSSRAPWGLVLLQVASA